MGTFLKYFLTLWALGVLAIASVAGLRGSTSRKPPIELFPDMDRQPKLRPQTTTAFSGFADGQSSRLHVAGTVARGSAYEENELNSGKGADGKLAEVNPLKVDSGLLHRGQERFGIYCQPCHGALGDGKGVTSKYGMGNVANLHQERLVKAPDGEIFQTLSNGKNTMLGYAAQIPVNDRWAIVAYVRALQLTRLGTKDDVPADQVGNLK